MTTEPGTTTEADPVEGALQAILRRRARRLETGEQYRTYLRWMGRGLEAPVSVVVGLGLGRLIGGALGHGDAGTWIGLFFGVVTAIRALVRLTRAYQLEEGGDDPA